MPKGCDAIACPGSFVARLAGSPLSLIAGDFEGVFSTFCWFWLLIVSA